MPKEVIFINLALLFYTIGVFGEKFSSRLKLWHLIFFILGVTFDTLGTGLMFGLAGGFSLSLHAITGIIAIVLMILHAGWAIYTLVKKDEKMLTNFHKFSMFVYFVWLVPYGVGAFLGMTG